MIQRTYIKDLAGETGKTVTIVGFVQALRVQSKLIFMNVRDVSGVCQVVWWHEEEAFAAVKDITLESVVKITGEVKVAEQAPGGVEIGGKSVEVLSASLPELPIPIMTQKSGGETEQSTRLDYRWLDLRKSEKLDIFKVWTEMERGFRRYYEANNYLQFYSPSFMGAPSETGAEVFEIPYFETKAYLAQSPQFYKQMAIAAGLERVFAMGPVFRAEHSFTTRHLTEFTGWDFEVGYIESHHDVMDQEEGAIVEGFKAVLEVLPETPIEVPERPFPRVTMSEAKTKLKAAGVESEEDHDLSPEEERELSRLIKEETGHDFVFVTDWHISKRPFYHMRHEDNPELTKSFDLLYRGIEVTTGAQREHRIEVLERQALEKKMSLEVLADYLNFFRYGCPPHGGVGMGPGRFIMRMLDLPNIREATFLPRDVKRLNP